MKKTLLTLLAAWGAYLPLQAQFNCQETKQYVGKVLSGTSIDYNSRSDTFDILHTQLLLDVRSYLNVIGRAEVSLAVLQNASNLRFDLQNFQIDSVRLVGNGFQQWVRQNPFLHLKGNYQSGDTLRAIIHYRGLPPADPSGWGGWHRTPDLAFNLGVGFGSNPHVYGRSLFPCFDNFVEHSTFTTTLLAASGQIGVSNGEMVHDSTSSVGRYTSWELTHPIPSYLYAVAVANFQPLQWSHNSLNGPIELSVYAKAADTANARQSFQHLNEILDAYEYYFGPFIWQRLGYVLTTVGAMEHATSIHLPINLANGTLNGEDIIAHELAHHWFGNLITCERAEDMWINEGWAEFCSHLYEERVYNRSRYLRTVRANRDRVLRMAALRDDGHRPLVEMPQDYTYGEHTYQKGAMVAHNLRAYMGDSLFFGSLQQVFQNRQFENFSIPAFQQALEQYSGLNLQYFFEDQVSQAGYAHFVADSVEVQAQIGGQRAVDIRLRQSLYAADHWYREVPLQLHLFDFEGNEEVHTITTAAAGRWSHHQLSTQLQEVEMVVVDVDGVLLTAHSPELQRIRQTGLVNFSEAQMQVEVTQLQDSALLLVEHHWVAPEGDFDAALGWRLSNRHYWTVQGALGDGIEAQAVLTYDGRIPNGGLDGDLLAFGEDSIVLMYREDYQDEWEEYDAYTRDVQGSTLNKLGVMRLSELKAGQYCFANGVSGIGLQEGRREKDTLRLWPNPAGDEIQVGFPKRFKKKQPQPIKLYDQSGRLLAEPSHRFQEEADVLLIEVGQLPPGSYWLEVHGLTARFEKE